jgi:hypothetical protein
MDYTELWKAVSMAKESDAAKSSQGPPRNEGTEAYDNTLHLLGIDIRVMLPIGNPKDVIDLSNFQLPRTVEYPNLNTDEQLQALADQNKSNTTGMNEETLAIRTMQHLFIFQELPKLQSSERSNVPCQILEFWSEFTSHDRFNKDLYTFVRGSKKERASLPQESDLPSRSNLTFMAHINAIGVLLRSRCRAFPGVHGEYNAIAPFLSIEFKVNNQPAKVREATHQIAVSSFVNLVERQRLPRPPESPYIEDKNIRHYAYTICGNVITVWCTTLQKEEKYRRSYTTYQVQRLRVLNLAMKPRLEEFLKWHRHIMTWGLEVYVTQFAEDLERVMGALRRESLTAMILSTKKVTQSVNSDGISEIDNEKADGGFDLGTEDLWTEYPTSEDLATKDPAIEALGIEALATDGPGTDDPMTGVPTGGRAKDKATEYTHTLPHNQLNAAAMSLSMTDRKLVKAYLTQLLDDIKRLGEELGGPHAGVKEEPGECASEGNPCKQASSRESVMAAARSVAHRRGKKEKGSASSLAQRPRWK